MDAMRHLQRLATTAANAFWLFWIVLFLAAVCCPANAAPPLIIEDSGYYVLERDSAGIPQTVKIDTVIDMRTGDKPDPPDPDDPDEPEPPEPEFDEELAAKVTELAEQIDDPTTALAITWVYEHVRFALKDDEVSTDSVWPTLDDSTTKAIAATKTEKDWSPLREYLTNEFNRRRQRLELQTSAQIQRALFSVQVGLGKSIPESHSIDFKLQIQIVYQTNGVIDARN